MRSVVLKHGRPETLIQNFLLGVFSSRIFTFTTKMDLIRRQRSPSGSGMRWVLFLSLVLCSSPASCMKVSAPAEVNAVQGETVTLSCQFTSTERLTSKVSIDWSFRPQTGGPSKIIFHFSSVAYPIDEGHFKGRMQWYGDPARSDASIRLLNASLGDNGTYSCAVRNPPDIQGLPSNTVLTVSPKRASVHFSDVAVLLFLILLPSSLIAMVLLARMLCPCCSPRAKSPRLGNHSPIEVVHGEEMLTSSKECICNQPPSKQKPATCCEMYLKDSDEEWRRYTEKHRITEAESHC